MTIDWWTLGIQTVNVVILVWLLGAVLLAPGRGDDRTAPRRRATDSGRGGGEAQSGDGRARRDRADACRLREEREAILAAAHEAAEQARTATPATRPPKRRQPWRPPRRRRSRRAGRRRHGLGRRGRAGSRSKSPGASSPVSMARRCAPPSWIGYFEEIRRLPEPARQAVAADGVALEVVSAAPLEPADQERYRELIGEALGARPQIAFKVDPRAHRRPGTARPPSRR